MDATLLHILVGYILVGFSLHIHVGFSEMTDSRTERTFIMVKPDGVQRGLVGEIMKRFESRGYKLVACKMCKPGAELLKKHYKDLKDKPYFTGLIEYMDSGPVVAMAMPVCVPILRLPDMSRPFIIQCDASESGVGIELLQRFEDGLFPIAYTVWEGKEVVHMGRSMLGSTNPLESNPGTIRGDFCIDVGRNICHGSDTVGSAKREIALWFISEELQSLTPCEFNWVYE